MKTFKVYVDDNYHFQDEDERYLAGEYSSLDAAIAKCMQIVDGELLHSYKRGKTADELFSEYCTYGEDPWVAVANSGFSAWDYARQRCEVICDKSNSIGVIGSGESPPSLRRDLISTIILTIVAVGLWLWLRN